MEIVLHNYATSHLNSIVLKELLLSRINICYILVIHNAMLSMIFLTTYMQTKKICDRSTNVNNEEE